MKLSNKILVTFLAIVILFQLAAMLKFRGILKKAMVTNNEIKTSEWQDIMESELTEKNYEFKNFSNVKIQMNGNVVIQQSDNYKILIKAPEKLLESDYFEVSSKNSTLTIKCRSCRKSYDRIDILVFMPKLSHLKITEDLDVKIQGFYEKAMEIDLTGDCSLIGENLSIKNLDIDGFGDITLDLKGCNVTNARVRSLGEGEYCLDVKNLEVKAIGESDFNLNLNEGVISGSMIGDGKISYSGELKKQKISFLGPGKIQKN
ncbi:MAG: DUF2807 domain-containing protein [Candidatus Marinimicrobia bacterium]|nr:DUF2807 domain-containing protein [Candidatus Neomarinimicrobiota bacterium]